MSGGGGTADASTNANPSAAPQDGTTNGRESGSALVKNLLFPSYTDAGSNEAFQSPDGAVSADDANNSIHQEADTTANKGTSHVDESMLTHTGAGPLNQSVHSDDGGEEQDKSLVNASTVADSGALSPPPQPRGSPLVPPTPDADAIADAGEISSPAASNDDYQADNGLTTTEAKEAQGVKSPPKMMRKTTPRLRPPTASTSAGRIVTHARTANSNGGSPDRASVSTMHSGASSGILGTKFLSDVSSSSSSRQQSQHEVSSTVSTEVVGNLSQDNANAAAAAAAEVSSTVSTNVMHNLSRDDDGSGNFGNTDTGSGGEKVLHLSAENLEKISPPKSTSKRPVHQGDLDGDGDDTSEANSMTSHMGSEAGDRKLRLDEVARMEVMAEEDEDGEEDDSGELTMPVLSSSGSVPRRPAQGSSVRTSSTSANVGESDVMAMGPAGSNGVDIAPSPITTRLSNAIHRIGSGVSQSIAAGRGTPGGAPPTPKTPRSPHPSPRGESGQPLSASISAMLRSPRLNHGDSTGPTRNNAVLSPRFSSLSSPYRKTSPGGSHHSAASGRSGFSGAPPPPPAPQNLTLSPFQRARECMSFDSSDGVGAVPGGSPPPSPSVGGRGRKTYIQHRSSARSPRQSLQQRSRSWDAESEYKYIDGAARLYGRHETDPLRQQHGRRYPPSPRQLTGISSASAGNAFRDGGASSYVRSGASAGRDDMRQYKQNTSRRPKPEAIPQRIEIEREDAINLLTCLVEQSIAFHEKSDLDTSNASKVENNASEQGKEVDRSFSLTETSEALKALRIISQEYNEKPRNSANDGAIDSGSDVASGDGDVAAEVDHEARMNALDELLRSHTYAAEMQRAALSASSWLKAIGKSETEGGQMNISYSYSNSSTGAAEEDSTKGTSAEANKNDGRDKSADDSSKMEIIALRAQLHAVEAKMQEKSDYAKRLDEELGKCRAEIGRLKSASRTDALFSSPNKSIFDVEEEEDGSSSSESEVEAEEASEIAPKQLESALKDVSAVIDEAESSQTDDIVAVTKPRTDAAEVDSYVKEIILLKAALGEANARLGKLEGQEAAESDEKGDSGKDDEEEGDEKQSSDGEGSNNDEKGDDEAVNDEGGGDDGDGDIDDDILDTSIIPANLSTFVLEKDLETYRDAIRKAASTEIEALNQELEALKSAVASQTSPPAKSRALPNSSPGNKDERMINARMLNAEDFVTEWDPIAQLPPPPDHLLRSPIVYELLSQWTSDHIMQESLLGWVENIMAGEDPSTVPPLKISSLNHQLKDGFIMHILPLLLRRPDIHVEVTTRAHRRTSYDMAVSITKPMPDRNGVVSFGSTSGTDERAYTQNGSVPRRSAPSNKHMMAFKASKGGISEEAEDENEGKRDIQQHVRSKVSEYLRGGGGNIVSTDIGAGSVANASDVTNRISNLASVARLAPRPSHDIAPLSGVPSADEQSSGTGQQSSNQEQPGLVGRAIGLLSRRKEEGQSDLPPRDIRLPPSGPPTSRLQMPSLTAADEGGHGLVYATQEEEEQYHRVVSVPPGKIGITFVQYRGHAMVSDVAPDSPLNGWIFPSDIVIAVDEKAVSGLRVREIVDLLKSRKDRQRALRVISSHDLQDIVAQEAPTALLG